jgi:hypothetical protein
MSLFLLLYRVANKAKIVKKGPNKLGKGRTPGDSQKSRFSALSRESLKSSAANAALLANASLEKGEKNEKIEKNEKNEKVEKVEKVEKIDKLSVKAGKSNKEDLEIEKPFLPKPVKKEKVKFEASIFLPIPRIKRTNISEDQEEDDGDEGKLK